MNITMNKRQLTRLILEKNSLEKNAKLNSMMEIEGVPCIYNKLYLPLSDESEATEEEQATRDWIWCFKNDSEDYDDKEYFKARIKAQIWAGNALRQTFGDKVKDLTFVCVPCHCEAGNEARWSLFSHKVSEALNMKDGTPHYQYIQDADRPQHYHSWEDPQVEYDKKFFNGKKVVLFDDLITSGQTLLKAKSQIESAGAKVVLAMSLGKTVHRDS